jgi:hypothetical protein
MGDIRQGRIKSVRPVTPKGEEFFLQIVNMYFKVDLARTEQIKSYDLLYLRSRMVVPTVPPDRVTLKQEFLIT